MIPTQIYGVVVTRKMILTIPLSKEVHAQKRFVSLPANGVLYLPEEAVDTIMTILGNYIRMNGKKMTKKNSSRLFVAGILTAAICLAFSVAATSDTHYSIEIIEVNGGYGYQISHNNHITIFQPFIPAISGKKPFMEKEDAKKVGKLVMRRMKTGENYTVTRHDLENLGIKIK